MFNLVLACLLAVSFNSVEALSPISIKGVSYVPYDGDYDPLLDSDKCKADAALMKDAGINTIYVYTANSGQNHDECMKALADQDIYVWLQLGDFPRITSTQERSPWTLSLYAAWTEVIDAFAGYDNTLAFGIGQETINENGTSTRVAPSLKAAARDLHAFSAARGYRSIPLAYSAADIPSIRLLTAQYLTCSSSSDDTTKDPATIDLLGFNIFSTESCAPSGLANLRTELAESLPPIPVVISESGCHPVEQGEASESQRNFSEVAAVLGPDLRDVFSGANVYEWTKHDETEFGLVQYTSSSSEGRPLRPQFDALSRVFRDAATVEGTPAAEYTPASRSDGEAACPTRDQAKGWLVDAHEPLPRIEGLVVGTVTVRATVTATGGSRSSSTETGGSGGNGGAQGVNGRDDDQLSVGAIAGIVVGGVVGAALAAAAGVLLCLRRRRQRRTLDHGDSRQEPSEIAEVEGSVEYLNKQPPSYVYPAGKIELPERHRAAAEMEGERYSAASQNPRWDLPIQQPREDSPTVSELPDNALVRRTQDELAVGHTATTAVGAEPPMTWGVSPLSPGNAQEGIRS
ncbi:Glucanosyltransferase-domain-containing protein [Corynascus novoguineensis]|uniref:1,3-beta-glucanosyltransferase n=1 Tax=Corynascus novoguineensis TaxID=1126955 RepID=A0AAN7HI89_9PEZI|nr:Glucanosyltransferase-domain-containing protein [Corynascus novoguineensis]